MRATRIACLTLAATLTCVPAAGALVVPVQAVSPPIHLLDERLRLLGLCSLGIGWRGLPSRERKRVALDTVHAELCDDGRARWRLQS